MREPQYRELIINLLPNHTPEELHDHQAESTRELEEDLWYIYHKELPFKRNCISFKNPVFVNWLKFYWQCLVNDSKL